jgi:hypothetical protein
MQPEKMALFRTVREQWPPLISCATVPAQLLKPRPPQSSDGFFILFEILALVAGECRGACADALCARASALLLATARALAEARMQERW